MTSHAYLCGEITNWPDMDRMSSLLRSAGLSITTGRYSIRLDDFSHFVFHEYGGDLSDPKIEADSDDAETFAAEVRRVSEIFTTAGLVHRFEVYRHGTDEMTHYFHHGWPLTKVT